MAGTGDAAVIHLAGPVLLAAVLAGAGVYGLLVRRNAVLALIGAELLLNAANVLAVTAGTLPAGGLSALGTGTAGDAAADPLLPGRALAVFVVTIAAAEIGVALALVLLLYRRRRTSDLTAVRDLGEAAPPADPAADPTDDEHAGQPAAPIDRPAGQPAARSAPSPPARSGA